MFLYVFLLALVVATGFAAFFAIRWAKIIFLLEDDLSEAIEIHERTAATLEGILKTPMFFDSPEIKRAATEALDNVKVCRQLPRNWFTTSHNAASSDMSGLKKA